MGVICNLQRSLDDSIIIVSLPFNFDFDQTNNCTYSQIFEVFSRLLAFKSNEILYKSPPSSNLSIIIASNKIQMTIFGHSSMDEFPIVIAPQITLCVV